MAIGFARLGIPATWISVLGDDELGELVLHRLRAEGVDTGAVRRSSDRPTGLYLREEVAGRLRVYYYRAGSAAATLAPGAFDPASSTVPPSCISPASPVPCRRNARSFCRGPRRPPGMPECG